MADKVVKHPAKFSNAVLDEMNAYLLRDHPAWSGVVKMGYDPFAGVGKVVELERANLKFDMTEIEREWAEQCTSDRMHCMDAFEYMKLPACQGWYDYVVTSPTYGNRMADHHQAKDGSKRHTYRHYLGRELSEMNSGQLQWGDEYRAFHKSAWYNCYQVMRPGGTILVNVKDHIRKGARQLVVDFHISALESQGFEVVGAEKVDTPGMKHGENGEVRVDGEWIVIAKK